MVINGSIGSSHDDNNVLTSSQDPSRVSPHQSRSVNKSNVLQSDMATTKAQLDLLEKSTDTKISNFQTNLESNFTRQISALDVKFVSKTSDLESKLNALDAKFVSETRDLDSKFSNLDSNAKFVSKTRDVDSKISALESKMNSKFDDLGNRVENQLLYLLFTAPFLYAAFIRYLCS
jgi:ABC-type molybdate transport system ATPase subunit